MKTLVIVESPSKAKKIQEYLGKSYTVMASKGHIADLAKGGKFGLGIDIDNKFKPRYVLMDDKIDLLDQMLEACEKHDQILLASDPDREGEAIAWHLAQRIGDCRKPIKRVEFKEITKKGIQSGIKNPRDININLFHSQEARRILDRIVGFMASPFLMNFFGPKLSAGRVQSVATKMIVDREQEITDFTPEEYWVIKSNLTKDDKVAFWAKYDPKVSNKTDADAVKAILQGQSFDTKYIVKEVDSSEEAKKSPPPLVTSSLQRIMAKSFGFAADRTMKAAQSLYENGYVTYIRTDSVRVEPDALKDVRDWLTSNGYKVPSKPNLHKNKNETQDAHECIRPTDINIGINSPEIASPDEKKVYELIWKYFVASQMQPAIYDTLKVSINVKGEKAHVLKASGKALKSLGFLEIMGVSDDSKIDIPSLNVGDELHLLDKNSVTAEKKMTQPPPRYSDDTLLKSLEVKNIGRPATYAEILSKIASRNYVEKRGNTYYPTDLGMQITNTLSKFFTFMKYEYTAEMEEKLDTIEQGKLDHIEMLEKFYAPFKSELDKAYANYGCPPCEKCNSPMAVRTSKAGEKFLGCTGYPKCKNTKPFEIKSVA